MGLIENSEKTEKKGAARIAKILGLIIVLIGIVVIIAKVLNLPSSLFEDMNGAVSGTIVGNDGTVTTISEASLEKIFEINELSTVNYAYNAIACAYGDDETTPEYYVAYNGTVTAGIDFGKIDISIDEDAKTITLKIPACEIQDTIVDFGSMEYIFEDDKYETENVSQEAYELCQSDLAKRAEKETDLLELAKENAATAVEALVNPWVNQIDSEYTIKIQ